ncbi:hypothetical protein [Idiomarina sp.]|uniref:hypothetical protein n=1 Tax=Idiomarina sp. TaxID=1874361 RepID=UPI00258E829D|nr:hypothetical protein [Idiomarina sp.]
MKFLTALLMGAVALSTVNAVAQERVDEKMEVPKGTEVFVDNERGSIEIMASDEQLTTQLQQLAKARQSVLEALASGPGNAQQLELLRWINEQELALLEQSYQQKPVLKQI